MIHPVWKVCEELTAAAVRKGRYAIFKEFERVFNDHTPKKDAKKAWKSISFKPWKEGLHQYVFPRKPYRSSAIVYLFEQRRNPDYKSIQQQETTMNISLCYGNMVDVGQQRLNIRPFGRTGSEPLTVMSQQVGSVAQWDFFTLAEAAQDSTNGKIEASKIERIRCSIGLQPLVLERSAAEKRKQQEQEYKEDKKSE